MTLTGKDIGQLKLRLPEDLRDVLKHAAVANARSLNSEVVVRLRETVEGKEAAAPQKPK